MLDVLDLPVAHDHVGVAGDDRRHQVRDVGRAVLVVGVGVDDDVGAELERRVESRLEAGGQPLVVGELDDVVDAVLTRDVDSPIGGAVVDDQPLDLVDAVELARQFGERRRQLLFLVEAGDLDDQLHRWAAPEAYWRGDAVA